MKEGMRFVGLDVHGESIEVAVVEADGVEMSLGAIVNRPGIGHLSSHSSNVVGSEGRRFTVERAERGGSRTIRIAHFRYPSVTPNLPAVRTIRFDTFEPSQDWSSEASSSRTGRGGKVDVKATVLIVLSAARLNPPEKMRWQQSLACKVVRRYPAPETGMDPVRLSV